MENRKISIVVPVYKVEENLLRRCIQSIRNQTLSNIQIILVDDGSPDNCGEICDNYAKVDNRIDVVHQENKGLCGARNAGLTKAKSEWITFVDADDWIEKGMCQEISEIIENNPDVDMVMFGVIRDENGNITNLKSGYEGKKINKKECKKMRTQLLNFNKNVAFPYGKVIKLEILKNNNLYYDEKLKQGAEDIEYNIRLFKYITSIVVSNNFYYHYCYNKDSITAKFDEENTIRLLKCFEKVYEIIIKEKNDELEYWFYNRMLYVIVTTAISGYFNPTNTDKYKIKVDKFKKYLENDLVQKTLKKANNQGIGLERKLILIMIRLKCFKIINLLAIVRRKMKNR